VLNRLNVFIIIYITNNDEIKRFKMSVSYKTKVTARSTYGDRFFEFSVSGKKESLEDIMRALAAERKRAGYTGEMLTDIMYTNFALIYACSPCNVTPINIPASSYTFGEIKHYDANDASVNDNENLETYTFEICLRGEGRNRQEAWEDAVTAFCLDPGWP
jgi:hypothetical protein